MFKSKLYNILNDLENHSKNRNEVFQESVEKRLQKALNTYDEEIAKSYNYLATKNSINVLKKLNRSLDK